MHRRPLLDLLDRYDARYPGEREISQRIRDLVSSNADCFDRTCRPGHVTASAWVVTESRERVLLVHHRKLDRWLQPGGHADGQTDVAAAALREANEETGLRRLRLSDDSPNPLPLDLDVHIIPARYDADGNLVEDAHEHHDVRFLVIAEGDLTPQISDESHDVRWFAEAAMHATTDEESVLRLWRKLQAM
ncbi:MAG: NUDIX hydrolase [Pirellulales bacterium]|nr:NUDIX hydrolase [Pirellulales bacterium]